jgi:hypothetical protein
MAQRKQMPPLRHAANVHYKADVPLDGSPTSEQVDHEDYKSYNQKQVDQISTNSTNRPDQPKN